jgi:hypothetical protein
LTPIWHCTSFSKLIPKYYLTTKVWYEQITGLLQEKAWLTWDEIPME